jgi:hypothetical protein
MGVPRRQCMAEDRLGTTAGDRVKLGNQPTNYPGAMQSVVVETLKPF